MRLALVTPLLAVRLTPLPFSMSVENSLEKQITGGSERPLAPTKAEKGVESSFEKLEPKLDSLPKKDLAKEPLPIASPVPISVADTLSTDERARVQAIENILADGLDQVFLQMSPQEQANFKAEGEKAATKISVLLSKAKVGVAKLVVLIRRWLALIPHVNKFFLEQEAKIKADKILKMKKNL
jgi:hypothetical protein